MPTGLFLNDQNWIYEAGASPAIASGEVLFHNRAELAAILDAHPGSRAVAIWNNLPGVQKIEASPKEIARGRAPKFRNRETAVSRIWGKLSELYPDAILAENMPKTKGKREKTKAEVSESTPGSNYKRTRHGSRPRNAIKRENAGSRKSGWAEELAAKLTEDYRAGQSFSVEDVYGMESHFKRLHKENKAIRPKLRQTLAVLRGRGFLKQTGRGTYQRVAQK